MRNKEKGITLIALVITIIVLLILAGVTLNLTIGENGIFNTAKKAAMEQKKQTYFEEINLEIFEEQTARTINPTEESFVENITERIQAKTWVKGIEIEDASQEEKIILIVETIDGYEIKIEVNNKAQTAKVVESYYEKVGKKITVRYDGNGGTGEVASQEIRKGSSIILPDNGYTRNEYEFVGWNTDKDNQENNAMQPGSEYTDIEENTTLYAIWSRNIFKIKFESNGGQGTITDLTVQKRSTVEALPENSYTKEGYKFKCWKDQDQNEYLDKASIENIEKDITLTAQWQEIIMTASIQTSSLKLTEGTTIQVNGTSTVGIDKIEVLLGNEVIYKELPKVGEEVIQSPYNKTIQISEMNLKKLEFYNTYTPKVKITAVTQNKEGTTSNITNYTIGNANSLTKLSTLVNGTSSLNGFNGEKILQVEDIDLNKDKYTTSVVNNEPTITFTGPTIWEPIGTESSPFKGTYNGNKKAIRGIFIKDTTDNQGLFGVNSGTIQGVRLENSSITSDTQIGGIVGWNKAGTVEKCSTNQYTIITANYNAGGIVGYNTDNSIIQQCYNSGKVIGNSYIESFNVNVSEVGGICGCNSRRGNNTISYCYNLGSITGKYNGIGGICGYEVGGNTISYCYNTGKVSATDYGGNNGGIAGRVMYSSTVEYSYNEGNIICTGSEGCVRWCYRLYVSYWNKYYAVLL